MIQDIHWKHITVNLSEKADTLLRENLRRKGDLSKRFREALENTNWYEVQVTPRRKTYDLWKESSVAVSVRAYEKLKECARERCVEISALIDAIIIAYYS